MLTIPLTDALGLEVDLQFDDKSDAAIFGLHALESKTSEIVTAAGRALDQTTFASCLLGGAFGVPSINVGTGVDLAVKSGANVTVAVHRSSDGALFDSGDASPDIPMGKGQAWVSFGVETKLDIAAGATSPSGFGVTGEAIGAQAFRTFALIESANGNFPTLKESVETALSEFRVLADSGRHPRAASKYRVRMGRVGHVRRDGQLRLLSGHKPILSGNREASASSAD